MTGMIRCLALSALVACLVLPATAEAAPQAATITDPADGAPALDGKPRPDFASLTVTQDAEASTVAVAVGFHGATFASTGGDLVDARLPIALGKASGASCNVFVNGSPDVSVTFSPTTAYGFLKVHGSTGMVDMKPAPVWNAGRTQLSWTVTNPALATVFDCVTAGPLYANVRSSASNPDSRYSTSCDCWVVFTSIDDFGNGASGASAWFPGREQRAELSTNMASGPLMATQTASVVVSARGAEGTTADATVKWFRGAAQIATATKTIDAGAEADFEARVGKAGNYRVEVYAGTALAYRRVFTVVTKIAKPVLKSMTLTRTGKRQKVTYRVCAPKGRLRANVQGVYKAGSTVLESMEKDFRPLHPGGCRTYTATWGVTAAWYGVGTRRFTVQVFDRFEQASSKKAASFTVVD